MEDFEWNVQHECQLLESMSGHKPIGINKSFQLFFIYDKFTERVERELLSELIWAHLETMYNLEALDESESIPFPNDETDFELPDSDFATLKEQKTEEKKNIQKGRETPKNLKELVKRDDKTPNRNTKEVQRRDSKDSRSSSTSSTKKEVVKREPEKQSKPIKGRTSSVSSKEEATPKTAKNKNEESARAVKRPTRGSLKPEETSNSGKASPVTVQTPAVVKRRRI